MKHGDILNTLLMDDLCNQLSRREHTESVPTPKPQIQPEPDTSTLNSILKSMDNLNANIKAMNKTIQDTSLISNPGNMILSPIFGRELVSAGSTETIYYYEVPPAYTTIITAIGNESENPNWATDGSYFTILLDKAIMQSDQITYMLGTIDDPKQFVPHLQVKREIEVKVYNADSSSHYFEVKCDGYLILK